MTEEKFKEHSDAIWVRAWRSFTGCEWNPVGMKVFSQDLKEAIEKIDELCEIYEMENKKK